MLLIKAQQINNEFLRHLYREFLSPFSSAAGKHVPACLGRHFLTETVTAFPFNL